MSIHPKFKDEKQCKNCGCYFLPDKPNQVLCSGCLGEGQITKPQINNEDVVWRDNKFTPEILKPIIKEAVAEVLKEYKILYPLRPKKCAKCGREFKPNSPNQKQCSECRNKEDDS